MSGIKIIPQFPNTEKENFIPTSPKTPTYNCIAWAYGDDTKWYWPDPSNTYFWPPEVPRIIDIPSFIKLYENIGYEICNDGSLEKGYEKVAIFSDSNDNPTHASRQLESGLWTSKLGQEIDISHTIFSMEDGVYGNVSVYMKRKR